MRPENTASVVRACIEHNLLYDAPRRLWYMGPMSPDMNVLREAVCASSISLVWKLLALKGPDVDAEQLLLVKRVWDKLGIKNVWLELNCLRTVCRKTGLS